eukprot:403372102
MESLGQNRLSKKNKNLNNITDEEDKNSTSDDSLMGRQLTNLELIRKAEYYTDTLKLEKSVSLYEEGLQRFPNDTLLLDAYTDLLIQMGEDDKAKQLIERSIQLNPNKEGRKYLNFAEMLTGADAVQMYRKGIEVFQKDLVGLKAAGMHEEAKLINKQTASAFSSIAELFMSEPLCDEPDAESECERCLREALKVDPTNLDALQQLANLRLIRARDQEAIELLNKCTKTMLEPDKFRMTTSRMSVELQQFKNAIRVLDTIIQEDDENPEAWYLLAFSHFSLKKYKNAKECLKNVKTTMTKLKMNDKELKQGAEELYGSVLKALGKTGVNDKDSDDEMHDEAGDDDEYETVSEEDISDDEEMKE